MRTTIGQIMCVFACALMVATTFSGVVNENATESMRVRDMDEDSMLERAAAHQESEMNSLINTLLGTLEPALIVFMGLVVLLIVMAILLPIFQINQLVA